MAAIFELSNCQKKPYKTIWGKNATNQEFNFCDCFQSKRLKMEQNFLCLDVEDAICAVTSAQYLSPSGWVTLRDVIDNDVPFGLYRDEGSTFLQVDIIRLSLVTSITSNITIGHREWNDQYPHEIGHLQTERKLSCGQYTLSCRYVAFKAVTWTNQILEKNNYWPHDRFVPLILVCSYLLYSWIENAQFIVYIYGLHYDCQAVDNRISDSTLRHCPWVLVITLYYMMYVCAYQ